MALPRAVCEQLLRADGGAIAVDSDDDAYRFCRRLAFGHYENFPVASLVLGQWRDDVAAIYAFARLCDDVADELPTSGERKLELLEMIEHWIDQPPPHHPIARAVAKTIRHHHLPVEPLHRLLAAFRYDAVHRPFPDDEALRAYCQQSAAPIGELLLRLVGEWNELTAPCSDAFCAGLQVLNFWQDVWFDFNRGRWTFPLQWLPRPVEYPAESVLDDNACLDAIVVHFDRLVGELLPSGTALHSQLRSRRLRVQVKATWESARIVWNACRARALHVRYRPRLHWWNIPRIVIATLLG